MKIRSITVKLANQQEIEMLIRPDDTIGSIATRIEQNYVWETIVVTIVREKE